MKLLRSIALCAAIAIGIGTMTVAAGAQSSNEQPHATDVGITPTEIHVAVIADVDTPLAPDLFKTSVDAVKGWARYVNSKAGGGGLAGRKVVVDFYDSKLNPTQTRNAEITACGTDTAMIGTSAVFLTSVEEMRSCKDATGAVTGIPDIPFLTAALAQQCSDQSFPIVPPQIICSTATQHPQTYQANVARGYYYQAAQGKDLHGIYTFPNQPTSAHDSQVASLGALQVIGVKSDDDFDIAPRATQLEWAPMVQTMKSKGSNYGQCSAEFQCTVNLRKEAALQGVTGVKVWDCWTACYDRQFLQGGGSDVEGEYVDTQFMPFYNKADLKANPMLASFVKYTGPDKAASFGIFGWAAGVAFAQAVDAQVKAAGINSVTRKTIFEQLDKIGRFDAQGILAPIDLAGRRVSSCTVVNQVKNGKFVRVQPAKAGTLYCPKNGRITRRLDLIGKS